MEQFYSLLFCHSRLQRLKSRSLHLPPSRFYSNLSYCKLSYRTLIYCILLLLFINPFHTASAQPTPNTTFNNNIFLELLGNGGYASVNYEHKIFQRYRIALYPSIGISTFKIKDFTGYVNPDLIIPVGLRMYYGSDKHLLVFGLGQTFSSKVQLNDETFEPKRSYDLSASLVLGYRMNLNRVNLQLAYTPILENYDHYIHWIGFAVGYRF